MNKVIWIDTETTGISHLNCGILQIAALYEKDGEIKDRFASYVKPFPNDQIDPEALKVNKLTREKIEEFPEPAIVFKELTKFLDKHIDKYNKRDKAIPAGYKISFDINFLKQFWIKNNDKYFGSYFFWLSIDIMDIIVLYHYLNNSPMPSGFKLADQLKYFDIGLPDGLHDAEVDIEATRKLFLEVMKGIKKCVI